MLADRNLSVSNELVRSDGPIERTPKLLASCTKASFDNVKKRLFPRNHWDDRINGTLSINTVVC